MTKLVLYRLGAAVPLLILVSFAVFSLVHVMPGSPAASILGRQADAESIAALEERLGLNDPFLVQYAHWFRGAVTGDFGTSLFSQRDVLDLITERIPATLSLTVGGVLVAVVLGVGIGVVAALRAGSLTDRGLSVSTALGLSVPDFWVGIILLNVLAVSFGWFPVISWTPPDRDTLAWLHGLVLPCLALGLTGSAIIARQMRGAMLEALDAPYVQTLRAIGTSRRTIVMKYVVKNAFVPVLTVVGFLTVMMLGGTFVIEQVFTIPGVGSLMLDAVSRKDMPVVQGVTLVVAMWVTVIYLLVDLSYGLLNPRVRPS